MINRIKNLLELSKFTPTQIDSKLELKDTNKPKGQAKIVPLEDPLDQFDDISDQ